MIRAKQQNSERTALTMPEVLLIAAICAFAALFLLMRLPRGREQARAAVCLSNLNQIGQALAYYVESTGSYPLNEPWPAPHAKPGTSIFVKLRAQADLWSFVDVMAQIENGPNRRNVDKPAVPTGLRCPSDRAAGVPFATNYRANAGAEPEGTSGPFAVGKRVKPAEVEAADGVAFTAAFAERLIGANSATSHAADYVEVESCEEVTTESLVSPGADAAWRKDAGHDWSRGDWVMSLYHHGLRPNSPVSAVANRENCAAIGSSGGHPGLVHVLLLDGSARGWRETVDANVWRRLGDYRDGTLVP